MYHSAASRVLPDMLVLPRLHLHVQSILLYVLQQQQHQQGLLLFLRSGLSALLYLASPDGTCRGTAMT